ncbi:MAG: TolC family protein, partial [Candidatus Saccharibacteria bacterium]|nr:TolC family protein [Pseudorhodobacter sp.]
DEFFDRNGQQPLRTSDLLTLRASMTLFDFGRGQLSIDQVNASIRAAQHSLVDIEQGVLLDAVWAYVDFGLQGQLVAAQEANVRLITQDLRAARDRFEVGEVTRTDVALAEAQLASARSSLAAAQGNYNIARESYKATIGNYPSRLTGLPKMPVTGANLEAAQAIARRTHPDILAAQEQAKAQNIGIEIARANMLPNVTGTAQLSRTFTGDGGGQLFSGGSVGPISESINIGISQTIYGGGRLSSQLRKQIALSQAANAELLQTVIRIERDVGNAWSRILVAQASIVAGDEQIRAAQAAYDGVKQEAELGSRTTLDVLDADQNLLSAKSLRLQAGANLYISRYQLLSAMGLLTADHLRLGIPTFDPSAYLNAVKNAPATSARGAKLDAILKKLGK